MQISDSSYPARQENYVIRKLPRVRKRMERSSCIGRVWIFLLLGLILIILGLVVIGVYFSVKMTTSSTTYTEIFPIYINAAMIIGAGLFVVPLFWKRLKIMVSVMTSRPDKVFAAVIISMVTGLFSGITAVVTATHLLQPIRSFTRCHYYKSQALCQCFSPYFRDGLDIQYLENEETKYDFENTSSCSVIQNTLTQLLVTLITVYSIAFLLCIGSSLVALLVLRIETNKRRFCEDEDYEEVYTVSASSDGSHNQSDSETEGAVEVVTSPTGHVTTALSHQIPANPGTSSLSHVTSQANQGSAFSSKQPILNSKSADNFPQKTPLTSRIKTQSSSDTITSDKLRTSRRNSKSNKPPDQDGNTRTDSLTFAKRLSRSCDSLDTSGCQGDSPTQDFGTTNSDGKQAGKLKAHRRKGRRAVTLHNLDTKQLMLILNLQMRYLEETKAYHSQKELNNLPSPRRAITPQPSSHQPKIPQNIRSHTPQPYRQNGGVSQQEKDFYAQVNSIYQNNLDKNGQPETNIVYKDDQFSRKTSRNVNNTAPFRQEKHNPYIHGRKGISADNVHYVTYSDNMLNFKGPKPKSRATVQDYFLPPQPIHRHSKNTLPPQPIRRHTTVDQNLPSEPTHRGKSAFHIVDCARNTSRSSSVSSERSDPPVTIVTTPKQRKKKSDYAEVAIRDNFQLNQNPYMFKNSQPHVKPSEEHKTPTKLSDISSKSVKTYISSEIPPPYTGPPSYFDFVSSCDNSGTSTSSSNQEEIYSRPVRRNTGKNSADDKYCFEIENKNLLKGDRDKNYNVRQPNLESVYCYTESLNDVQNCHGDIKVKGIKNQGHSSQVSHHRVKHSDDLVRDTVYTTPSKSKVKQCIVPEDYYTPIHKVSRNTPVYANAKNVESADKLSRLNKNRDKAPSVLESSRPHVIKDQDYMIMTHPAKFGGYVYAESNQIAPDEKYHEYEDVYDTPGNEEPVLVSYREVNEMRKANEERNGHTNYFSVTKSHDKESPKKTKVKATYPEHSKHVPNSERVVNGDQRPDHSVDKPKYNIPTIVVNDGEMVEDDVFITDPVHENGARKNKVHINISHGARRSPKGDNCELYNGDHGQNTKDTKHETEVHVHEINVETSANQIADEKYSAYYVVGKSTNQNEDADHVTGLASQSSESDQERQMPEGTDENSDNLVDNSSEEECAETGV